LIIQGTPITNAFTTDTSICSNPSSFVFKSLEQMLR